MKRFRDRGTQISASCGDPSCAAATCRRGASIGVALLLTWAAAAQGAAPVVQSIEPMGFSANVATTASIKLEFSASLDNTTLAGVRLLGPGGFLIPSIVDTDATLGAVDLKPLVPLAGNSIYTVDVTSQTRGANGESATPFTSSFATGNPSQGGAGGAYRFGAASLGDRPSVTSVAFGPDGHLYASDGIDSLWRYPLNPTTGLLDGAPERIYQQANMQTVAVAFSTSATADNLVLYASHADRGNGGNLFTGTLSRFAIPSVGSGGSATRTDVIVGLPHPTALDHQPSGFDFGPDGKLYYSIGGMATLGGSPNWGASETLLSGAVLVADVEGDPAFGSPVNVNTSTGYDPLAPNAPVRIFSTGLRNAYDLAWHSNGQLYSGINANSLNGATTPDDPNQAGNQAINAKEREMLALVREGLYYGHPNPSRGEYILNGGNPTNGADGVWEVSEYAVGASPEPNFAGLPGTPAANGAASGSSGILYDTRASGGNSPNGLAEYTGTGALNGKLLVSYFSGARTIQTFTLDPLTGLVSDTRPLENPAGQALTLNGPLDVTVDPASGRVYVADFGLQSDFGQAGRIMMLSPIDPGTVGLPPAATFEKAADNGNPRQFAFDGSGSTDDVGIAHYLWSFGDGSATTGVAPNHLFPRDGQYVTTLTVVDSDGLTSSASMPVTIGTAPQALFVVSGATLNSGDAAVFNRLQSLGFEVSVMTAAASTASQANGKNVVVVSSTVNSTQVNTKFTSAAAGVVTWESFLFDDLRLTGAVAESSFGLTDPVHGYVDVASNSPLAGGLSGDVLFGVNEGAYWGVPGPQADVVATMHGDATRATFFAYEAGDALFDGSLAAGNRVGFFLNDATAARMTGAGWRLFDNAILFASGLGIPSPGDFNGDGVVDGDDLMVWSAAFGGSTDLRADADGDGVVGGNDFLAWQRGLRGVDASATEQAVPEPGVMRLLALAIVAWFTTRRR